MKQKKIIRTALSIIFNFLLCMILFVILNSCCKEIELSLPEETTIGAEKFGCYVDDELFVYTGSGGVWGQPNIGASLDTSANSLTIFACTKSHEEIRIVDSIIEVGRKYPISNGAYYTYNKEYRTHTVYWFDKDKHSEICLTRLDVENKIVSGTFSFMAKNRNSGEYKTISEGRFDVKILW